MRNVLTMILAVVLVIVGLGLLYLTNTGILSFRKPIIRQLSAELTATSASSGQAISRSTAFVNVNVIPMDSERILENQTVIVRDGRIAQMGASILVPEDAVVVDGDGRYLMPGLTDMHVHIKDENELLLFVANGVTAVRDMWGTTGMQLWLGFPDQLVMREQINQGELLGPRIFTAGPIMEGDPPTTPLMPVTATPQEAAASVARQAAQGYDFIKVYDNLTPETYQAILDAAQARNLPVVGHVPKQVGLDGVLAGGQQTIEHLTGYIDPDAADFIIPVDQLADYATQTAAAGVWNCVTLGVYPKNVPPEAVAQLEKQPGMETVSPQMRALWNLMLPQMVAGHTYDGPDYPARITEINWQMTQALHEAGAKIILGTDTDNPYLVPGFSLLDELDYLVAAGFTPYEAILAGTRHPAEALGRADQFGQVAVGMRADLILLAANPLLDVGNVREQAGVMVNGRWLLHSTLQTMLDDLIASYTPALFERLWPLLFLFAGLVILWQRFF